MSLAIAALCERAVGDQLRRGMNYPPLRRRIIPKPDEKLSAEPR